MSEAFYAQCSAAGRLWAQALGNAKGVLSEKTANAMASPQFKTTRDPINDEGDCHYGYGLFIDEHHVLEPKAIVIHVLAADESNPF